MGRGPPVWTGKGLRFKADRRAIEGSGRNHTGAVEAPGTTAPPILTLRAFHARGAGSHESAVGGERSSGTPRNPRSTSTTAGFRPRSASRALFPGPPYGSTPLFSPSLSRKHAPLLSIRFHPRDGPGNHPSNTDRERLRPFSPHFRGFLYK